MSELPTIEELISGAAKGGWEWFEGVDPKVREMITLRQQESGQKAKRIAATWAKFASTPAGREALEAVFDVTLRRTVFFVQLGEDVNPGNKWGYFREGQNAVAHELLRQIKVGQEVKPPKPRERP